MKKYLLIVLCFGIWNCEEGADGLNGENGQDGVDGENGLSTILYTLDEPSGDNCANSGTKIVYGIDINNDAVLLDSEIDNSTYICNGNNGQDGTDGQDGEVETEEQHPLFGVWFQADSSLDFSSADTLLVPRYNTTNRQSIIFSDDIMVLRYDGNNNGLYDQISWLFPYQAVDNQIIVYGENGTGNTYRYMINDLNNILYINEEQSNNNFARYHYLIYYKQ